MKITRLFLLVVLVILPLVAHVWLRRRDKGFDDVVSRYECEPRKCEADFNKDGRLEKLERDRRPYSSTGDLLILTDGNQQFLSIPYHYIDGTLRTHVGIDNQSEPSVIVFDGTSGGDPQQIVFRWRGEKMVQTSPSPADREILRAMAARDESGSWTYWALHRAFALQILIGYYILLSLIVAVLAFRTRFNRKDANDQLRTVDD